MSFTDEHLAFQSPGPSCGRPSRRARQVPLRAAFCGLLALSAVSACASAATDVNETTGVAVETATAVFPVSRSANGRYLQDATGTPFPILGRSAWFITSLTDTEYEAFLDDTAAKGFDVIEFHVINHDPRGNDPPFAGNGALPFLKQLDGSSWSGSLTYSNINTQAPDLTTPNEAYWTHVDALLSYAESKGIVAFMFPAYVGYNGGDQGYMQELVANGPTKVQSYGAWIASRYAARKNVVWMLGGDMGTGTPFSPQQSAVEQALLTGLKSVPGQQSTLFSAEWSSESIATDQVSFGSAMSLNGAYSWSGDVNTQCRRAYSYAPVEPAFLLEEPYDEEGPDGNGVNPSATQPVRRFEWWGWLSGVGGYMAGNGYIWPFNTGWQNHLDTQGARDLSWLNGFIRSVAWQNLVPSGLGGMGTIVTAGAGSGTSYVAAAAAPSGSLVVAYVPPDHSGSITVDMTKLSGPVRVRWLNPTTGAFTNVAIGLPNVGTKAFTPPGDNGTGFDDWVLVLDLMRSVGRRPPPRT